MYKRWIKNLSRGYLKIPNADLINICKDLNEQFEAIYRNDIDMRPQPIERLLKKCLQGRPQNEIQLLYAGLL